MDLIEHVAPGWVELPSNDPGQRVLVQVERRGDRYVITAVVVAGTPIDSTTLKSIPVARIEVAVNHPDVRLAASIARELPAGERFPLAGDLRKIEKALTAITSQPTDRDASAKPRKAIPRPKLTRPDGTDPEGFYRKVAEAYNDLIVTTAAPAPVLAEEAGVPVPTVHRWIAEARRRGFLPPARRGRVG